MSVALSGRIGVLDVSNPFADDLLNHVGVQDDPPKVGDVEHSYASGEGH
jgi:hypothetical protein